MTPGPSRRYRDETPLSSSEAGETSFGDDSFTSALTDVISPSSALRPRESDPFVVNPSSRVPGLTLTRSSDQRDQLRDSRGEVDDELVDDALDTDGDGSEGDETELDISSNSLGKNIADKVSCVSFTIIRHGKNKADMVLVITCSNCFTCSTRYFSFHIHPSLVQDTKGRNGRK